MEGRKGGMLNSVTAVVFRSREYIQGQRKSGIEGPDGVDAMRMCKLGRYRK
jgi:hypothetical protein